jgi:aspartyl-tRNA(Asn)/glutamyl-tRNA(Gln) amidotransferase subunit B
MYKTVIGLEVHAQLLTNTKLFSHASTHFGQTPNTQTTPYCLAHPGTLPVLNEQAVNLAIKAGCALNCTVNELSAWSRKHYFYPDLPKGYQITQFEIPICEWGFIELLSGKKIQIRRIHLEEDAGKQIHDSAPGFTLVDLNRAGTPLIEIVTEPDFSNSDEVLEYLKSLREILVAIGVNDGNLEEGSFRCDANVSVMRDSETKLGTRCEIKNLNSFRHIESAIAVEVARHIDLLENGKSVTQETRLFDVALNETRSMRSKEDAHDYRYFPEPDLPPLQLTHAHIESIRNTLPELPRAKRNRYVNEFNIPMGDAQVLTADVHLAQLFESTVAQFNKAKMVANWCIGEVSRLLNVHQLNASKIKFTPVQFVQLLNAIESGIISNTAAKGVFEDMFVSGKNPIDIIAEQGLTQLSDTAPIELAVDEILASNVKNVEAYKAGNTKMLGFFVGQAMKKFGGKANPKIINEVVLRKLSS